MSRFLDLKLFSPWIDDRLVPDSAQHRIDKIIENLPDAFRLGVLECRIDGKDNQVDYLAGIASLGGGVLGIKSDLGNSEEYSALFKHKDFLREWGSNTFSDHIPLVWFEYDLPNGELPLREPGVGISLSRRHFNPGLENPSPGLICRTATDALNLIAGKDLNGPVFELLEKCIDSIPKPGMPLYLASLAPRGLEGLRLVVELHPSNLKKWLLSISHPRMNDLKGFIDDIEGHWERIGVQIELKDTAVLDYLAIELYPEKKLKSFEAAGIEKLVNYPTVDPQLLYSSLEWAGVDRVEEEEWPLQIARNTVLKLIPTHESIEVKSYLCYNVQYSFWR